jgi:hypothetical protein
MRGSAKATGSKVGQSELMGKIREASPAGARPSVIVKVRLLEA